MNNEKVKIKLQLSKVSIPALQFFQVNEGCFVFQKYDENLQQEEALNAIASVSLCDEVSTTEVTNKDTT